MAGLPGQSSSYDIAGLLPRYLSRSSVRSLFATTIQFGNPRAASLAQERSARIALDDLTASGIGTDPLSPFDALVEKGDPVAVAKTFATQAAAVYVGRAVGRAI